MRERNALPAVLVGGNLRNDLRGNVARRRERMRLLNERTRNDRAVLQHVLKIDQVAVVHVLRKIVGIMEMNEALVMRLHDVARQKNTAREILGDFPRHIVALHGVHRGILVGIFLLDFLVVALDEREDLRIRRVRLTNKRTRIAICDILARNRKRLLVHDLVFHEVLDLLHVDRAVEVVGKRRHFLRDERNLLLRKTVLLTYLVVCLANGVFDFLCVERNFCTVSLDDLHSSCSNFYFVPFFRKKAFPPYRKNASIIHHMLGFVKGLPLYFEKIFFSGHYILWSMRFLSFFRRETRDAEFSRGFPLSRKIFPVPNDVQTEKISRIRRSDPTKKPRILRPNGRAALPCFRAEPFR